ncbi:MAG: copper resistance system multicopper oxidase [Gammaproteobacteria bacterium]|nr:copper resistance system multicopper oxidase [Gammaproteobacteria bacterium]
MVSKLDFHHTENVCVPRRRFVQGLAMGSAIAALGLGSSSVLAAALRQQGQNVLRGNQFDLILGEQPVNFTGVSRKATTVNGSLPAPILRWREGEDITLRVTNMLLETSSIHWHGIILPSAMDGVPGIATGFNGIKPGETFMYKFPAIQSGTYWYHSHSGFQEQTGLYGAIVIDPKEPEPFSYDRDYVVMLSDWSDEDPNNIYAKLKKLSHYYNFNERTHSDLMAEIREKGAAKTWSDRKMWNQMRMSQRDLSDVTGYTYTHLMNGQTPADGWMGVFKRGEKIRLRFINGSAMTFFDVRIPGLKMTVVSADGQNVQPVSVDEFRIGVAETYDVIVEPKDDIAYTLFAQSIDRSGYARGTLTPDPALKAEIPEMDPVPNLTHGDMGMAHGMGHSMDHDMPMGAGEGMQMDHSQHNMPDSNPMMDHSKHNMDMNQMDHSQHNMGSMDAMPMNKASDMNDQLKPVKHAATEYGPHVDMRSDNPQYRLDDPGVGLRNNGRRVLTYADLKNLRTSFDMRDPDREIELHLTGNMVRYMWSINGVKFADAEPLRWKLGELIRITFVNDTMMNHPMHLHGMWSDLETGDNQYLPRKHTVVVQPGSRISYRVTVDAEGGWAYHCHLLYHMLGMFRKVEVSRG